MADEQGKVQICSKELLSHYVVQKRFTALYDIITSESQISSVKLQRNRCGLLHHGNNLTLNDRGVDVLSPKICPYYSRKTYDSFDKKAITPSSILITLLSVSRRKQTLPVFATTSYEMP